MHRPLRVLILVAASLLASSPAGSRTRPDPCDAGRYFVGGGVVLVDSSAPPSPDVITIGDTIDVLSGCPAVRLKDRVTRSGTRIKVTFKGCAGIPGNASLKAKIDPTCLSMSGTFRAKKAKINKGFKALRSVCDDGIFDPLAGEECDAGLGCSNATCVDCTCTGPPLPTTTVPNTSSSSTSSTSSSTVVPTTSSTSTSSTTTPTTSTTATSSTTSTSVAPTTSSTAPSTTSSSSVPTTSTTTPSTTSSSTTAAPSTTSTSVTPTTTTSSTGPPVTLPDLRATAFTSNTLIVDAGGQLELSWTVVNEGPITASQPWTDFVNLSTDQVVGGDVTSTSVTHTQNLTPGGTYDVVSHVMNIPNIPAGTYFLILRVDANGNVNEGPNENDNTFPTAIEITVRTPDLRPTAFDATPTTVDAGGQITLSWTVLNEGTGVAKQPWTDFVNLSTDMVVGGDITSTSVTHTQDLAVGADYDVVGKTFAIPNIPAGQYFLILRTDANGNVYEGNDEGDNTSTTIIPITVRTPDLRATAFTGTTMTVDAGSSIMLSWTVTNEGTGVAKQSWTDFVNLSTDEVVGGDITSTSVTHNADLAVGNTYDVVDHVLNIPNIAAGNYFLILRVDANGNVYEGNDEGDNTFTTTIPITVRTPDLRPTAFGATPLVVDAGGSIDLSWTVTNEGTTVANQPWTDFVNLSTDMVVGGDITSTSVTHTQNLAGGGSYDVVGKTFNIPNIAAGTYFLILRVDANGNVYEGDDEGDNTSPTVIEITVRTPDLRATAFDGTPTTVAAGGQMMLSWTVTNEGTGVAKQPWTDFVNLSTDEVVGGDVTSTSATHTQDLAVGDSYSVVDHVLNIPNIAAGQYFLILRTDANGNVYEGNDEGDNTFATTVPITVQTPDLRATSFNVDDTTVTVGQIVNLSWTVTNEGTGTATQPWTDFVNFSTDQVVGGDVTSTSVTHSTTQAAGTSYDVVNKQFTIPSVTPGTYFLILRVDANGNVYEGNDEGDNTFPTAIQITVQ